MERIGERITAVREQIAAAAQRAGRRADEITLIAVSKTHPAEAVAAALAAGVTHFGENRVQEADAKIAALSNVRSQITWHLIGHLQRNKAKVAAQHFDVIHSLDSLRLAETLDRQAAASGRRIPVLLQVNVSGEASKEGFALPGGCANQAELERFSAAVAAILALPHLAVQGLMTIAPFTDNPESVRPVFRALRELRAELTRRFPAGDWRQLSMGMTDDYPVAIEEGATLVRIGRAIFGARS